MQAESFRDLTAGVGDSLIRKYAAMKEHAEHIATEQVTAMKESGEAVELSDDELDMLKAYKRFVARSKPGAVFQWRSPETAGFIVPPSPSFLVDPREVAVVP
jgi:hypothetical protein